MIRFRSLRGLCGDLYDLVEALPCLCVSVVGFRNSNPPTAGYFEQKSLISYTTGSPDPPLHQLCNIFRLFLLDNFAKKKNSFSKKFPRCIPQAEGSC